MATAAFSLMKCTGVNAATETDSSKNPCFVNVDMHTTDTGNNQVAVPPSGDPANYSYENWLLLKCTNAPNNKCENFKFWGPNQQPDWQDTPGNKMTIMAGTTGTGATPVDSASIVATSAQHSNYYGPDPGIHLAVGVVPGDNQIDAVNEKTDYIVLQLKVEASAQRGDMATISFSVEYDES